MLPLAIAVGGALGALMRYWVSQGISVWLGHSFPYGTLTVNILGSGLIGFLSAAWLERMSATPEWTGFWLIGLLGAFTTFSTFSLETLALLQQAAFLKALVNILVSVFACLAAAYMGILLAKAMITQ